MIHDQGLGSDCILWVLSVNIIIDIIIIIIIFIMLWSNGIYHNAIIYLFIYSFFREVLILKHAMMLLLPWKDKIFLVISIADLLSIEAKWVKILKSYIQFQIQWNMSITSIAKSWSIKYNLEIPIFYIKFVCLLQHSVI